MSLSVDEVMKCCFLQCMVFGTWVSTFHFSTHGLAVVSGFCLVTYVCVSGYLCYVNRHQPLTG